MSGGSSPAGIDRVAALSAPSGRRVPARQRWALTAAHTAAVLLVVAGALAALVRPLAPDLGRAPDPGRWFSPAYFARVDEYHSPLYALMLAALALRLLVVGLAAWSRPGRRAGGAIVDCIGRERPSHAAAAVAVAVLAAADLVLLPLTFWVGYVHEGAFGFRTQGVAGWTYDWLVSVVPAWLLTGIAVLAGATLVRRLPRAWPPLVGIGGAALAAALVYAGPVLLEPLRFDTHPLPPGPVRTAVEELLARAGEPVDAILVADASRRTTKQNAYVSGLGATRRVVLYDTLLAGRTAGEVALVLAHELGHELHGDVGRATLLNGAGAVVTAYAVAWILRWRVRRGRQAGEADPRAAALVVALVVGLQVVTTPFQLFVSRRAEAAADLAALDLTEDPQTYADLHLGLARANLADPDPPGWVYSLWYTHPTISARLELGRRWPFPEPGSGGPSAGTEQR